jgi:hypothetical protein
MWPRDWQEQDELNEHYLMQHKRHHEQQQKSLKKNQVA